jgi:MFS family permease
MTIAQLQNTASRARQGAGMGRDSSLVIALVTAAMFIDAVFFALIAPLLPHYKDALSLDQIQVALLFAAHPAGTVLLALPAARLTRSRGSALTMTLGLGSLATAAIVFGLADSLPLLVACRFVQGASAALVWCAGLARLQGVAAPERRGAALGLAGSAAGAGSLFGPAFAALSTVLGIEATLFVLGTIAFTLAVGLFAVGELPDERRAEERPGRIERGAWRSAALARPFGVILVCGIVFGAVATIAPLRLAHLGAGVVLIAAAFALSALGEIFAAPYAGHVSDRVGRLKPIRFCLALAAPLLLIQGLAGSIPLAALAVACTGSVVGSLWPLATAFLGDESSRAGRPAADVFATSVIGWSVGLVSGSLLGAALVGASGDAAGYAALASICLLALAGLHGSEPSGGRTTLLPNLDCQPLNPSN